MSVTIFTSAQEPCWLKCRASFLIPEVDEEPHGKEEQTQNEAPDSTHHLALSRVRPCPPFYCDRARPAGVIHLAGVDLSTLRNCFKHHHGLEGPVSILDQACGDHPSLLFMAVPEPPDFNVAWVETVHRADQEVVVLQGLSLCRIHSHCRLHSPLHSETLTDPVVVSAHPVHLGPPLLQEVLLAVPVLGVRPP